MDWVQSQACKIFLKKSDRNHFIVKCAAWKGKSQKLWKIHDQILPLQYKQVGIVLKLIIYLKSFASLAVCAFQIPVPELLKIATLIISTIKTF